MHSQKSLASKASYTIFDRLVLVEFSEHYDLVDGLRELPASENEEMRSDGSGSVAIPLGWRVSDVLAHFPLHFLG